MKIWLEKEPYGIYETVTNVALGPLQEALKLAGLWSWAVTIFAQAQQLKAVVPVVAGYWSFGKAMVSGTAKDMVPKATVDLQQSPSVDLTREGISENMLGKEESHVQACRLQWKRSIRWPDSDKTHFPKANNALVTSDPASQPMAAWETKQQPLKTEVVPGVWRKGHKWWEHCPHAHCQEVQGSLHLLEKDLLVKNSFCFTSSESSPELTQHSAGRCSAIKKKIANHHYNETWVFL